MLARRVSCAAETAGVGDESDWAWGGLAAGSIARQAIQAVTADAIMTKLVGAKGLKTIRDSWNTVVDGAARHDPVLRRISNPLRPASLFTPSKPIYDFG